MRSIVFLLALAGCGPDVLPAAERLDDNALAMAAYRSELYWVAEKDGIVDVNRRGPDETRTLWRRDVTMRSQFFIVAGPDGAVLWEFPTDQPVCTRFTWIRRDGTSEELVADELCEASPQAQVDGALIVSPLVGLESLYFDLASHAITPLPAYVLFATEREYYALTHHDADSDLVRIERDGQVRTLATGIRQIDRFAISPDAIYGASMGWQEPTTIVRISRESGSAEQVFASISAFGPPGLNWLAWTGGTLWGADFGSLYHFDGGSVAEHEINYDIEQLIAYDNGLAILTNGDVEQHMRLVIQRLP